MSGAFGGASGRGAGRVCGLMIPRTLGPWQDLGQGAIRSEDTLSAFTGAPCYCVDYVAEPVYLIN